MLKSNSLCHSKNLPVKFGFSLKTVPANIVKKLPPQRCSKPLLIAFFNFSHKRPTFAFPGKSAYTLAFRKKIAHKGTHAKTGAFSPSATAGLCVANEIAPITTFATLDSATLLYTYISRFSVPPTYQQKRNIRQSCHHNAGPNRFSSHFSTSRTNGPHSLSQMKAGTPSAFGEKSHTRAHTAKQRPSLPQPQHSLELPAKSSPKEQPEEADARLWRVSASSGVAAPLGCVIFFCFCQNCGLHTMCSVLSACARRGVVSPLLVCSACCRNSRPPLVKTTNLPFSEIG